VVLDVRCVLVWPARRSTRRGLLGGGAAIEIEVVSNNVKYGLASLELCVQLGLYLIFQYKRLTVSFRFAAE